MHHALDFPPAPAIFMVHDDNLRTAAAGNRRIMRIRYIRHSFLHPQRLWE